MQQRLYFWFVGARLAHDYQFRCAALLQIGLHEMHTVE